jgi:hypothetical protein
MAERCRLVVATNVAGYWRVSHLSFTLRDVFQAWKVLNSQVGLETVYNRIIEQQLEA